MVAVAALWAWREERRTAASAPERLAKGLVKGRGVGGAVNGRGADLEVVRLEGAGCAEGAAEVEEEFCLRDLALCFLEGMVVTLYPGEEIDTLLSINMRK